MTEGQQTLAFAAGCVGFVVAVSMVLVTAGSYLEGKRCHASWPGKEVSYSLMSRCLVKIDGSFVPARSILIRPDGQG